MSPKQQILDPSEYDLSQVAVDIEGIRKLNPQRFELEMLTQICLEDADRMICVGFKDTSLDDFWVRGHMPGAPLMPGVLICEVAAQLAAYFAYKLGLDEGKVVGLGSLDDVRFRGVVRPGDRLVLVVQVIKARSGAMVSNRFQALVDDTLVCEGRLKGILLPDTIQIQRDTGASA